MKRSTTASFLLRLILPLGLMLSFGATSVEAGNQFNSYLARRQALIRARRQAALIAKFRAALRKNPSREFFAKVLSRVPPHLAALVTTAAISANPARAALYTNMAVQRFPRHTFSIVSRAVTQFGQSSVQAQQIMTAAAKASRNSRQVRDVIRAGFYANPRLPRSLMNRVVGTVNPRIRPDPRGLFRQIQTMRYYGMRQRFRYRGIRRIQRIQRHQDNLALGNLLLNDSSFRSIFEKPGSGF